MGFLDLTKMIQRQKCKRLIQTNERSITFSVGDVFGITIGKTENASQIQQASELAVFMDTLQYEMCVHSYSLHEDDPKKSDYIKKRFSVIMALSELMALQQLALTGPSEATKEILAQQETLTKFTLSVISEETELFSRIFKLIPPSLLYRNLNEKELLNELKII